MKNAALVLFICLSSIVQAHGQNALQGRVMDAQWKPLAHVQMTLHKTPQGNVVAFFRSDAYGQFSYPINWAFQDTIWVKASLIGYLPQQLAMVKGQSSALQFVLIPGTEKLPDVVVKNNPIWQRNDTLNYQASAFAQVQDRSVGDIIRRLPGMEVTESGQIRYQGKPINKYYIEGLDLLEDRYGLANQNLPADAVSQIQVLENHQPISALDSIAFSDRAALNIKLKPSARRRLLGQGRLASGLPFPLAEVELAAMRFAPKTQWLGTYKFANTGRDFLPELQRQNLADFVDALRANLVPTQQLQVLQPGNPNFSAQRYLRNRQHSWSLNGLIPLKNDFSLRTNVVVSTDKQQTDAVQQTRLFLPLDTLNINEVNQVQRRLTNLEAEAQLLRNHKRFFLKNELRFQSWMALDNGWINAGGQAISQQARFPFASLSNHLQTIVRKGQRMFQGELTVAASRSLQDLAVQPTLYPFLDSLGWRQGWDAHNFYLSPMLTARKLHSNGNSSIWFSATIHDRTFSTVLSTLPNKEPLAGYGNELRYSKRLAALGFSRQWQWKNSMINLQIPLGFQQLRTRLQGRRNQLNAWFSNPQLSGQQQWGNWFNSHHQLSYEVRLPEAEQLLISPVFTNYRSLQAGTADLRLRRSFSTYHSLQYRRPLKLHFAHLGLRYNHLQDPYLADQNLLMQLLLRQWKMMPNVQQNWGVDGKFSQYIPLLKTTFTANAAVQWSRFPLLQKTDLQRFQNVEYKTGLEAQAKPNGWMNVQTKFQWTLLQISPPQPLPATQSSLLQWTIDPVLHLGNQWIAGGRSELALLRFAHRTNYWFADAFLRFMPRKRPWDLELQCQNLGNTQTFGWIRHSATTQVDYRYALRPRQVLVSGHFKW